MWRKPRPTNAPPSSWHSVGPTSHSQCRGTSRHEGFARGALERPHTNSRVVDYYRPIFWITPLKAADEKGYSLSVGFCFRRKELRFRLRSWQVKPGQSSNELRFFLSHFPSPRTSSKRIGPRVAPRSFCGDVPLVNAIRSSATDAVANRRTMNTTTGLASGGVAAPVAGKPLPSCRYFLFLTHTTVCWLAVRRCGGASRSTAPGKRPCLRSKIRIACPILAHFAAGPTDWTALSQPFLFFAKRSPA